MEYPFKDKIKQRADKRPITIVQLGSIIGKSDRWIHMIKSIDDVTLDMINKISTALEFDFLADYNFWLKSNNMPMITQWHDPPVEYKKKSKDVTVTFGIRGERTKIALHMAEILSAIQTQVETYGMEVV
ncbi:hypothetical protein [Mucilaginibacter sp.]|uniref:hypothetical protein n=1 Tax=Mucilaginibacter sp. TaxID=1882438 RepID=UPI0035BBF0F1